jgi:hypothetical protein
MARDAALGSARSRERSEAAAPKASPSLKAKLALVVVGLLLPLVLAEIGLRLAGAILPGDYQTASFAEAHPEFGRRNRPGAGWKKTSEYTSWIEVNSKGLRGAEIDYSKPPGEQRILVVGDSFTFAEQVNQNETFSQRLEDRLNAEGGRYRVLNAGSNGWATANEAVYLAKEGVRFKPDVVIVALYLGNDISDNYRRVSTLSDAVKADLALRGADSFDGPRRILRRSELYTVFESGVLAKLPIWNDEGGNYSSDRKPPRTQEEADEAWAITERLLDRMRDLTESQSARFVVMVVPSATAVSQRGGAAVKDADDDEDEGNEATDRPGFEDPHGTLAALTARNNLTTIDLLQAMRRADNRVKERLYFRQNAHWTAAGHAIAADELYDFLDEQEITTAGGPR